MSEAARVAVYTVPSHRSFADALASGLIARFGKDPLALAKGRIFLPNNRAVRAITEAFVRASGNGLLLPRLIRAQIVKGLGNLSNFEVGLATALPYAAAALTMYLWGSHSDRVRERTWHVAIPAFVGALGLALSAYWGDTPALALAALCLCVMGCYAALPVFWTLPTSMLAGSAAAAGIALVNSIGNTGGFLGPTIVGFVTDATGSFSAALWTLAGFVAASGVVVLATAPRARPLVATSETQRP